MKRIKANFSDIINNNIEYHAHGRVKNVDGLRGTRFILSKELTQIQREYFGQFQNILIGTCYYKYAPEIQHDTIIIFDNCLKGSVKQ